MSESKLEDRQLLFLAWLLDPRPVGYVDPDLVVGAVIGGEGDLKGSQRQIAELCETTVQGLGKWRRNPVFQKAFRQAVKEDLTDPTYMLDVVRHLRSIATGEGEASASESIKAADLYARLVGYQAPVEEIPEAPAQNLSKEELERVVAAEEAGRRPALSLVEALQ